jgi:hypothetical protein
MGQYGYPILVPFTEIGVLTAPVSSCSADRCSGEYTFYYSTDVLRCQRYNRVILPETSIPLLIAW